MRAMTHLLQNDGIRYACSIRTQTLYLLFFVIGREYENEGEDLLENAVRAAMITTNFQILQDGLKQLAEGGMPDHILVIYKSLLS